MCPLFSLPSGPHLSPGFRLPLVRTGMAPSVAARPRFERSWSSRMRDSVSNHRNDILLVLHRLKAIKTPVLLQHDFQEALKKASEFTPEVLGKSQSTTAMDFTLSGVLLWESPSLLARLTTTNACASLAIAASSLCSFILEE